MSQAKVDRYKKEKKNRAKEIRKKKIKKVIWVFVGAILVGGAIGYPLGKKLYKVSAEKRKAEATINSELYDYWSQQYWAANHAGIMGIDEDLLDSLDDVSSDTDAEASDTDATASDTE